MEGQSPVADSVESSLLAGGSHGGTSLRTGGAAAGCGLPSDMQDSWGGGGKGRALSGAEARDRASERVREI